MRRIFLAIVSLLFIAAFMVYMFTYTVRFTEVAVVTTLGEASDDIVDQPGLKFKLPSPIQSTTVYDKRVRVLRVRSETMSTADNRQLVVETFMTWRVDDPLRFYQRFRRSAGTDADEHYDNAEETLVSQLRGEMSSVIGRYRMSELFAASTSASRIGAMEDELTQALRTIQQSGEADGRSAYGVEVVSVGLLNVELPEETTKQVMETMRAGRTKLAAEQISAGRAEKQAIESEAVAGAQRIRAFAQLLAAEIESLGDAEAAEYLKTLNINPDLAVFLKNIELLESGLGKNVTLILTGEVLRFFAPESFEALQRGELPSATFPRDEEN
ncbi:MAG: SPFH domain-containing protein [Phycisphaerales bacterium]